MPGFNLDDYEPVADRIERFWKDHPSGQIQTDLIHRDEKSFIVKAAVWRSGSNMLVLKALTQEAGDDIGRVFSSPDSTGYAEEIIGSTNVNRTSALENCETSAIGRALANLGYAVKNRASREEMAKAQPSRRPRSGMNRTPSIPESQESHTEAPRTNGNDPVAEYTRQEVARFRKWTEDERADSFKRHSKSVLGGKPTSEAEATSVLLSMEVEYYNRFPEESRVRA